MEELNQTSAPISPDIQNNQPSTISSFAENITSQFIVTPLSPYTLGVSGYVFDIIGNEEMMLESDITDHWIETNKSIQDQIALRPEQFTLSGYVGEIANDFPELSNNLLTALTALAVVPGIGPVFDTQDQQVYNALADTIASAQALITNAQNLYNIFTSTSTTATKQQNAFQFFYNMWLSNILCQVETPWGILTSMAILNVRARQDETTRTVSDFSVTFKAMRFATTSTTTPTGADLSTTAGRSTQVLQGTSNATSNAITSGTTQDNSTLTQAATALSGTTGSF